MKTVNTKKSVSKSSRHIGSDFFDEFWEESWTYIRTVVDVLREPVLILDKKLKVLAANEAFYSLFQVTAADTEGKLVYDLGNGQWDIPKLRDLLEDILPKNTFFKGFEVDHKFPAVGQKTMILNARHIYSKDKTTSELFPPIIMLAMEDVTSIMSMAQTLVTHTVEMKKLLTGRTHKLELQIKKLETQVKSLKKK
ncbi:MAG: Transcriptional regulator, Fis family [Parcubacteria group bacterium GW2011_GWF2_44_8]|nr:MAG: Transcriptional regulator, Fis family [Parcubacteria group bacterium GW2011_GWF2_44_8]